MESCGAHRFDGDIARLFMPQIEQFDVRLRESSDGAFFGMRRDDRADVSVWVRPLGRAGVITSHRIAVHRDMPFYECAVPSLCIGTLSADSLGLCPIALPDAARGRGNVAVFGQGERAIGDCWLRAGSVHDATSIMLLPAWFDRFGDDVRAAGRALIDEPGTVCADEHAADIRAAARSVSPLFGGVAAAGAPLMSQVTHAMFSALDWRAERDRAECAAGCHEQATLVRAAKRHVETHMDRPLSLDALAHDLLTSRTRLCAAFKQETGEAIGSYIRRRKMARACELLDVHCLTVADVARAVGYARLPSFTVAFERACGCAPSAWREGEGR